MKKKFRQKGFTLLEVMIAMVILSVGLLGMAALTASIVRTNSFSDDFTVAIALAQDKLEAIANATWDSSTEDAIITNTAAANDTNVDALYTSTAVTDYQENVGEDGVVVAGAFFTRTWNIWDRIDLVDPATRKEIAVIVSWTDDYDNVRTITMTTIKTQTQ